MTVTAPAISDVFDQARGIAPGTLDSVTILGHRQKCLFAAFVSLTDKQILQFLLTNLNGFHFSLSLILIHRAVLLFYSHLILIS